MAGCKICGKRVIGNGLCEFHYFAAEEARCKQEEFERAARAEAEEDERQRRNG